MALEICEIVANVKTKTARDEVFAWEADAPPHLQALTVNKPDSEGERAAGMNYWQRRRLRSRMQ